MSWPWELASATDRERLIIGWAYKYGARQFAESVASKTQGAATIDASWLHGQCGAATARPQEWEFDRLVKDAAQDLYFTEPCEGCGHRRGVHRDYSAIAPKPGPCQGHVVDEESPGKVVRCPCESFVESSS